MGGRTAVHVGEGLGGREERGDARRVRLAGAATTLRLGLRDREMQRPVLAGSHAVLLHLADRVEVARVGRTHPSVRTLDLRPSGGLGEHVLGVVCRPVL